MKKLAVITGVYKDPKNLRELLVSLENQTFKNFDILIYNNSGNSDLMVDLEKKYKNLKVIDNHGNIGFAGGNNSCLKHSISEYEFSFLINDDTRLANDTLELLLKRIESDFSLGSVSPKMVFYKKFVWMEVKSNSMEESDIFIDNHSFWEHCNYKKYFIVKGFSQLNLKEYSKIEKGSNLAYIPISYESHIKDEYYEIPLHIINNGNETKLIVKIADVKQKFDIYRGKNILKVKIKISDQTDLFDVIQNAGSGLTRWKHGFDFGSGEIDYGQFDNNTNLEMFCGGAVMIRNSVLIKIGLFDQYLFNYYEDADLSMRFKNAGWQMGFEYKSKVYHYHAASSVEWSDFFIYYVSRNYLIFILKNFGLVYIIHSFAAESRNILSYIKKYLSGVDKETSKGRLVLSAKYMLDFTLHIPIILLKRFKLIQL